MDKKKWNRLHIILDVIVVVVSTAAALYASHLLFGDRISTTAIVDVVFILFLLSIKQFLMSIIFKSDSLKEPYENEKK